MRPGHRPGQGHELVAGYEGVLGTALDLRIRAGTAAQAQAAAAAALSEIDRLEPVFSRFLPESELNRWLRGELGAPSAELSGLLRRAEGWRRRTNGAFHPGSDALSALWQQAGRTGVAPDPCALATAARQLQRPLLAEQGGAPRPTLPLNLNAFAKGHIADRAAEVAARLPGVRGVLVNLGGDLRHIGAGPCPVDVADPFSRAENTPAAQVRLERARWAGWPGAALASSGHSQRGVRVGALTHSHLLDPRTGQPVWSVDPGHQPPADAIAGASVLAPGCASADALATALCVLPLSEGLRLCAGLGAGALVTLAGGQQHASALWKRCAQPLPARPPPRRWFMPAFRLS